MELPTSDKHGASQERERTAINEAQTMKTDADAQIYLIGDIIGMLDQSLCQPDIQEVLSAAQPFFQDAAFASKDSFNFSLDCLRRFADYNLFFQSNSLPLFNGAMLCIPMDEYVQRMITYGAIR